MHAVGSDDNDEEVKVSVDDEESDNSQRSDVKLKISEDLGKKNENKEDKIEEKENEDIQTGYDLE
jgi:hypothetical protein